jgi:TolB-like protein/class 3 adenylate cyclase/Tfp pilus assembly protein PilF
MQGDGATSRVLHLVFTDLEESTALKAARGDLPAGEILERARRELARIAGECAGRIVDFAGDGCFLTFETSSAAVLFALRLQDLHSTEPELPRVRVGIHVGEVTERAERGPGPRVEGLAVDLASRVSGLAQPGQVLVSSSVAASARPRLARDVGHRVVRWQSHGRYALKGASEPLEVVEVGLEGIAPFAAPQARKKPAAPRRRLLRAGAASLALLVAAVVGYFALRARSTAELAPIRSIAVLPVENLSGDPQQEYLADGMTESLIGELAKIGALRVISRTSVMQYKGARRALPEIARELGVDGILEGTVQRAGAQVRVTAQLIDARSDHHLWAQSYDRELRDVLQIQSEVARAVAGRIAIALTPGERARLAAPAPVDPRAQEAYLRGLHRVGQNTPDSVRRAIADFEEAVRIAPAYARAHAGVARAETWLFVLTQQMDREGMERARAAAMRAIELDEGLGEAHGALASVLLQLWNWEESEREHRRALELNPNDAGSLTSYAVLLAALGRREEAIARGDESVAVAPLDLAIRTNRAVMLLLCGQPERGLSELDRVLEIDPGWDRALLFRFLANAWMDRYEEAVQAGSRIAERRPERAPRFDGLERAWRDGGPVGFWRHQQRQWTQERNPLALATAYVKVGEVDAAFEVLEEAYAARYGLLAMLTSVPSLEPLHADPRFADLARRMNLPLPPDARTRGSSEVEGLRGAGGR